MLNEKRREFQKDTVDKFEETGFYGIGIAPTGIGKAWILIECLKRINPESA